MADAGDDLPDDLVTLGSQLLSGCQSRPAIAVSYIDAQGGAGKTRFAMELCRDLASRGWVAGLLPRHDRGVSDVPLPRLVTVDYVEERDPAELAEQIAALARSATVMSPVRVLILSRPARGQTPRELWTTLYLAGERTPGVLASQAEWHTRLLPALAEQMYLETTRCQHNQGRRPGP